MKKSFLFSAVFCSFACSAGIQNELSKRFLPPASDKLTFATVSQKLHEMDIEADLAWTRLPDRAAYDAYRRKMHARLKAAMGEWPERTSLNARTLARVQRDGYAIEEVVFESMPGLFVTANLFIPESKERCPAIVMSCGHADEGKDYDVYLRACVNAVRKGFVAFMFDPYEQGERRQIRSVGSCSLHNIIGLKADLIGWSMAMLRTWDAVRAVDYIETRQEVDKDRIGFMGQSGGGTMTALMTAVDWRLKATAPSCYLTTMRHLCESIGPQDAEQNVYGQLKFGFNHTGCVLLADTKVAVTCKFLDMFSIYGTLDLFRTVRATASNIGTSGNYALNSSPGPHGWTESTMVASVDWMRAWLKGEKDLLPLDTARYHPLDIGFDLKLSELGLAPGERGVTPTGRTMDLPGARDIHDIMRGRLAEILSRRPSYTPEERNAIAAKLAAVSKPSETRVSIKELASINVDGATLTRVAFVYPDGLTLPACWIVPANADPAKAPVMMIGQKGRGDWSEEVKSSLAQGIGVLVADITGYGEIGRPNEFFYGARDCPEEGVSVMLYLMGESMVGRRATDMLVIADWLKAKTGRKAELLAKGSASIAAAHARAADTEAFAKVSVTDAPMSWTDFLKSGDIVHYRYTYTVVNALLHYDWPDLLEPQKTNYK